MKTVAVTQRVVISEHGERRDALDQRWFNFLARCGLLALPLPNNQTVAAKLLDIGAVAGLLLTGGNDLAPIGGDAPERDTTELKLIEIAIERGMPILGVCRGMQVLIHRSGGTLVPLSGHVTDAQEVEIDGVSRMVNSYHTFGFREVPCQYQVRARAKDGVVKALQHVDKPIHGVMWHPERLTPFQLEDIAFVRQVFAVDDGR